MNITENALRAYRAEYATVEKEIVNDGPLTSCSSSLKRLDAVLRKVLDMSVDKLCCSKGCWYCCHLKVDVKACEALLLADFIKSRLSKSLQASILEKARQNAAIIRSMTEKERLASNLQCPLLVDRCCSVYEVRPANCRIYHSIDLKICERTFNEPTNLNIPEKIIEDYKFSGEDHYNGFCAAIDNAKYDNKDYELNIAIFEALTNQASFRRYKKKKRTLLG